MDKKRIEDIIAEARAEEKLLEEERKDAGLRQAIRTTLEEHRPTVTIDLDEYIYLRQKDLDLDRLLEALFNDMKLNYNNDELTVYSDKNTIAAVKTMYPKAYNTLLATLLDVKEEGNE